MPQHKIKKNDIASNINKKITYILNTEFIKVNTSSGVADRILAETQNIVSNFKYDITVVLNKNSMYDFAVDIIFPLEKNEKITMSYRKVMSPKNPKEISGWKAFYGNR